MKHYVFNCDCVFGGQLAGHQVLSEVGSEGITGDTDQQHQHSLDLVGHEERATVG